MLDLLGIKGNHLGAALVQLLVVGAQRNQQRRNGVHADDDDADQQNQQKFRPQMQVLPERLKLTHGGLPFLYLLYL